MTHRGKRSGLSLNSILFFNAYGIRTALASTPQLAHHSIAFFSETWDPTSSPLITDKDFFSVAATKPPGRGRPYGGLHMYINSESLPIIPKGPASLDNSALSEDGDTSGTARTSNLLEFIESQNDNQDAMLFRLQEVFQKQEEARWEKEQQTKRKYDEEISVITDEQIANLEAATRGQAGNRQWQQVHQYRITSSSFGTLCKATERRDLAKLARTMTSYKEIKKAPTGSKV
ncbi:hypothetical protein GQR58_007097 [Nymphon striatum]|nr:hypothetical protein GQR58_007097 [Nymphon striatum]